MTLSYKKNDISIFRLSEMACPFDGIYFEGCLFLSHKHLARCFALSFEFETTVTFIMQGAICS